MSKRDILLFLFKWKYSLIGNFLLVVAVATLMLYVLPKKYGTSSVVLVEGNRAPVMRSNMAPGNEELVVLNSAVAIIQSNTVLSTAVDKVGLGTEDEPLTGFAQVMQAVRDRLQSIGLSEPITPRESLIKTLEDKLVVEPLANSSVIRIGLNGKNPQRIADLVNAVTDSYIEHHISVFSARGTSEIYRLQVERLAAELAKLRQRLADFKRESAVPALDQTQHALVQQQTELTSELAKAEEELAQLQTRYGPGHTKRELAARKVANIQEALADRQGRLAKLEIQATKIGEIELSIESIERSYQEYIKRYSEERMYENTNPEVVNVRVIHYARAPTRPRHSRLFYVMLAAIGGFGFSVSIALLREYFNHTVNDPEEVARILGIPNLGYVEKDSIA